MHLCMFELKGKTIFDKVNEKMKKIQKKALQNEKIVL